MTKENMDPLSHATLGATCALQKAKEPKELYTAVVCGTLAGMFPDLDILIRSSEYPLLSLQYHRHFTHSLIFVPFGALIVSFLLSITFCRKTAFKQLYMFCFLGMALHGVLDSLTNYGTHLFWPFTEARESWNIISIVDPIFTGTLLICILLCRIKKNNKPAKFALCFALAYWSTGFYQQQQVKHQALAIMDQRRHSAATHLEVKPSLGNLLAWRAQYIFGGRIYADGYHQSPWKGHVFYPGGSIELFEPSPDFLEQIGPIQTKELGYFTFFSDDFVARYPQNPNIITDMRFAALPNRLQPLWGIELYPGKPEKHIRRVNTRTREDGDTNELWNMIMGNRHPAD